MEVTMRRSALVAVFCMIALPCFARDRAEFQKIADRFVESYAKGDVNSVLQLYAEDAYLLPPQAAMARGRSNIAGFWNEEGRRVELKQATIVDVKPLGSDLAHVTFTLVSRTRGEAPKEFHGKGAALAQKVSNDWKMLVHVWNRDSP
jgi:ketosteroid isomerase-like protein